MLVWAAFFCMCVIGTPTTRGADPAPADVPIPETGPVSEATASFDRLMRSFLRDNDLPGGALAVARNGQLVYARGFGFADRQRRQELQPDSLFRIASLSKPITAVALLRLSDQGRVDLDAPAFQLLPHRPDPAAGGRPADERLESITIRQLLWHRGGWDRSRSEDPMFQVLEISRALGLDRPANSGDILRYMMGRPLDFEPGTRYAYSNFGYSILGRIIEQATGQDYETHVREKLLKPLGIHRARIGRSLECGRREGEVTYYTGNDRTGEAVVGQPIGRQVPRQYGCWSLETMDAHGGWIASAVELVRFASQVQHWQQSKLLSPDAYRAMVQCPESSVKDGNEATDGSYYGLGWRVRPAGAGYNLWHTGGLPGTSTLLVQRHDGLCWAVLFNKTYTPDGERPASKIDRLVHKAANAVEQWPEEDLFARFLPVE